MKNILKYIIIVCLILLALLAGIVWGNRLQIFKTHETESSHVLMERISKVFKLVAVEGYVSEIYDYKQYKYWDVNFLRKKVLVRVKAKVSVGYDFEAVAFRTDEKNKRIYIESFPEPEILSIDHDLDYYDMDEGLFNSFSESDLTELNKKAKNYIVSIIEKGSLFDEAEEQKEMIFEMLSEILKSSGWELVIMQKRNIEFRQK